MQKDQILEKVSGMTKTHHPRIVTEPDEDYPTLKLGDYVVDYGETCDDLCLVKEGGRYQISCSDWVMDCPDPASVLRDCLASQIS